MSKIWDHFDRTVIRGGEGARGRGRGAGPGPAREEEARCKHCPTTYQIKKGGTASLRYHLKNVHGRIFADFVKAETAHKRQREAVFEEVEEAEREYVSLVHETPRKKARRDDAESDRVGTLDKYRKFACGDRRQLKFDMAVTTYLVSSGLPFHHVESDSFKEFIQELQPRVTVKSANCFSQSKLPRLHSHMVKKLPLLLLLTPLLEMEMIELELSDRNQHQALQQALQLDPQLPHPDPDDPSLPLLWTLLRKKKMSED